MTQKTMLMILDGWGRGNHTQSDVIYNAHTPHMDRLESTYPTANLQASGEQVGLPEGQMGNSEVGHLNIGAGRIVYQDLVRINKAIEDGSFRKNKVLDEAFTYAREKNVAVHFVGLVSDGGVHSSDKHLFELCDMTKSYGLEKVFVHALTDGRDTDPQSGYGYVEQLQNHLKESNGKIASVVGRYYGMDRDKRWERIKKAYDLLVKGEGASFKDPLEAIKQSYEQGITDEFIEPAVMTNEQGEALAKVQPDDVVVCFNFRTDRLRELTMVLTQQDMPEHEMNTLPLYYVTLTRYDESFKNIHIAYEKANLQKTLGEVVAEQGKKQIRIAETEKYAHVTFFFSGGREAVFEGEDRILVPSPKVATYDLQPEMSAPQVKEAIVERLHKADADFICLNFANGDMVGHTGVYSAIKKAVETVDSCVGEVVEAARENGYEVLIIADHGNADFAVNEDGSPNTAHSTNPVPCVLVSNRFDRINEGILADVAPTLLKLMGIEQPKEMTGKSLV
ncbi:MAG: 2,3-bisphosphoglycerate-independent phosphoglycerate mutase [Bacteroidales bacterium]